MAYTATTWTNIRKGAFKAVRTCLLSVHADIGTKVYSSYPLTKVDLPLITIMSGLVQPNEESETLDALNSQSVTMIVNIHAKEMEMLDTYADAVTAAIRAADSTFYTNGLILQKKGIVDNGNADYVDINNNRSHVKSISVTFEVDN